MKISGKKFILLFIISGFAFLFAYNVLIRSVVRGMPENAKSFLGSESLTGWKRIVSTILYPVKIVLIGPMIPIVNLPDPPPPFVGIAFVIYWTVLALVLYYLLSKLKRSKRNHTL